MTQEEAYKHVWGIISKCVDELLAEHDQESVTFSTSSTVSIVGKLHPREVLRGLKAQYVGSLEVA